MITNSEPITEQKIAQVKRPEDARKSVGGFEVAQNFVEMLDAIPETKKILAHIRLVANLFAGDLNESFVFLDAMIQKGNQDGKVVAVDKTPPSAQYALREIIKLPNGERRFSFVQADVFKYLDDVATQAPHSVDLITALGAEYVFSRDDKKIILFLDKLKSALSPTGIVIAPFIGEEKNGEIWEKNGFKKIGLFMYQISIFENK